MSNALATAAQRPLGAYYTPDALARALVGVLPIPPLAAVLEPHAGGGAFVRAILQVGRPVFAMDIDPTAPALQSGGYGRIAGDFLTNAPPWPADWIIGNPPFQGFEAHVDRALGLAPNVAFLLRLAAMESSKRADLWRRWPLRHVWVIAERPSFTGGGTDSAAYGWFWFDREWTSPATLTPGWRWR